MASVSPPRKYLHKPKLPHNDWLRVLFEGGVFNSNLRIAHLVALRDLYRYDLQSFILGLGLLFSC